jgi:hypothetical protein
LSSKGPRHSAERPSPLAFADVKPILVRLEPIADSVVIDSRRVRVALPLNERVFPFCLKDRGGRTVEAKYGADPFDAVVGGDNRLPTLFRKPRYPQIQRELAIRRAKRRD